MCVRTWLNLQCLVLEALFLKFYSSRRRMLVSRFSKDAVLKINSSLRLPASRLRTFWILRDLSSIAMDNLTESFLGVRNLSFI